MGNLITSERTSPRCLQMSNGSTDVLMVVLVLAGSDLARTDWQKRLVAWLAEHDQGVFGSGMVGFDLADIGWTADWPAERDFFLAVIRHAMAGHRWGELGYDPPFVGEQLATLLQLVETVDERLVGGPFHTQFFEPEPLRWCEAHRVWAHPSGCLLCHSQVPIVGG